MKVLKPAPLHVSVTRSHKKGSVWYKIESWSCVGCGMKEILNIKVKAGDKVMTRSCEVCNPSTVSLSLRKSK